MQWHAGCRTLWMQQHNLPGLGTDVLTSSPSLNHSPHPAYPKLFFGYGAVPYALLELRWKHEVPFPLGSGSLSSMQEPRVRRGS